ncbi:MAG: PD-(D/E)XK nuclease family protein [Clostridia bacterium]|nr:PD-(D/E)XK nuclease family protein [Clostridia bacterium]
MTNELLDSTTINKIAEIFDKERENGRATGKNFNLLEITEIEHKETKICLVLRNLLDPKGSHCQGSFFLERFCRMVLNLDESELPHEKLNTARVIKEYSIYGSNRRIDIVIITSNHFIPIEVKIGASDEKEQCYDYYMETSNRIGKDAVVFYLTPNGKAPYKNSSMDLSVTDKYGKGKIRCISFKDDITAFLLECINDESICSNPRLCDSLTQLLDTVGKFSQNDLSGNLLKNIKDVIPKEITSESLSDNRKKFFLTKTLNRFKQKENLIEKDARIIDEIISSHNWKYCISDDIGKTSNGESIAIFITVDVHEGNAYWGITLATCKGKPDDDKLLRRKKGDPKVKAIINEKIREHYGRINTWVFKEQRLKIMNPDSINFYRILISDEMEDFIEEVVFDVDRIFKKYRSINDTD